MSTVHLGLALGRLVALERHAASLAATTSPKLAARQLEYGALLHRAFETMRAVPVGTPGLLVAQDLWLALERCGMCFLAYDPREPRDVSQLREALEEARTLANVARVIVGAEPAA